MEQITINQALEEILATLQYTPDRQEINEKELDRLYGKKEEMSPEEKITYAKCLLVSAMINDGNKVARRKQALYILYSLRDEQSPEVQAQIAYYRAVAHQIEYFKDDNTLESAIEESPKGQPASDKDAESESPDDAVRHFNLGCVLGEKGDLVGAESEYRKAIGLRLDYAVAVLLERGDLGGAIQELRGAVRLNPKYVVAYIDLGEVLIEKGDLEGAEWQCRKAIGLDSDNTFAHFMLGFVLNEKGDLEGAIGSFSNVPSSSWFYGDAQKQIAEYEARKETKIPNKK